LRGHVVVPVTMSIPSLSMPRRKGAYAWAARSASERAIAASTLNAMARRFTRTSPGPDREARMACAEERLPGRSGP
jgi:hypothetical protein